MITANSRRTHKVNTWADVQDQKEDFRTLVARDMHESETGEEWRALPGYEGLYSVSNLGRLFSHGRPELPRWSVGRLLNPSLHPEGYRTLALCKNGVKSRTRRVCQLVMEAFVGPRPSDKEVLHGNGDHADDRLWNLRYGTHAENMADAVRHGTAVRGERSYTAKLTAEKVLAARADSRSVREIAAEHGVDWKTMSSAIRGRLWKHL